MIALAALAALVLPAPELEQETRARIDQVVSSAVDDQPIDGLTLLVSRHGEVELEAGWGSSDAGRRTPSASWSAYRVGNLQSLWITLLILRLADEGEASLDASLAELLSVEGETGSVTLEQLLRHTSGLPAWTDLGPLEEADADDGGSHPRAPALARLSEIPLEFDPGSCHEWSDTNVVVLSWILADATGQSLRSSVRDHILGPFGLDSTLYCPDAAPMDEHAGAYELAPEGRRAPMTAQHRLDSAELCSTAEDLLSWHTAWTAGELVRPATLERALAPTPLSTGELVNAGIGVLLSRLHGEPRISYGGGMSGGHSLVSWYPERDEVVVLLARGEDVDLTHIELAVVRALRNLPEPELVDLETTGELRRRYVGAYYVGCDAYLVEDADGRLVLHSPGEGPTPLQYQGGQQFADSSGDLTLEFVVADDRVTAFVLTHGGSHVTARRVT